MYIVAWSVRKMIDNSPENYAFVKSLNGNKFTIKDLLNYEKHFDVS